MSSFPRSRCIVSGTAGVPDRPGQQQSGTDSCSVGHVILFPALPEVESEASRAASIAATLSKLRSIRENIILSN